MSSASEDVFRDLLGVPPEAGKAEIRKRYYRLARENHPDFFPQQDKALQEMKMMALNEAYAWLAALSAADCGAAPGAAAAGAAEAPGTAASPGTAAPTPPAAPKEASALALPRDPAYVYYKQGFLNFSRALHGIAALSRAISADKKAAGFEPERSSLRRFAGSLVLLRRAHAYFRRVVEDYPDSIWRHDARIKLRRIDRFNILYRKIVSNLQAAKKPSP
jgi:hypothetical protein